MRFENLSVICYLFLLLFFDAQLSLGQSLFVLEDNVSFSFSNDSYLDQLTENPDTTISFNESDGLTVITHNPDSINNFNDTIQFTDPMSTTLNSFVIIKTLGASVVKIIITHTLDKKICTFECNTLISGVYKFEMWNYLNNLASGIYYLEMISDNKSHKRRILIVR